MFRQIALIFAQLASTSANNPIRIMITISVLASAAYLSILDIYIPATESVSEVAYYLSDNATWSKPPSHLNQISSAYDLLSYRFLDGDEIPSFSDANVLYPQGDSSVFFLVPNGEVDRVHEKISQITKESSSSWRLRPLRKSFSWVEWISFSFKRLVSAVNAAETFDVCLIGLSYLAMYVTFTSLFVSMRNVGSRFWLALSILMSSILSFLLALFTINLFNIDVSLKSMSEGLPFLVVSIGFRDKINFTTHVLNSLKNTTTIENEEKNNIASVIIDAVTTVGTSIIKNYIIEIVALLVVSLSGLPNVSQFSLFAAVTLVYDCLLLFSFYSAILAVKIQINRVKRDLTIKATLAEEGLINLPNSNKKNLENPERTKGYLFGIQPKYRNLRINAFKILSLIGFITFNIYGVKLLPFKLSTFDNSILEDSVSLAKPLIVEKLSLAGLINTENDKSGVLITFHPTRIYQYPRFAALFEDLLFITGEKINKAITDRYLSKIILIFFGISIAVNAYFLRATGSQIVAPNPKKVTIQETSQKFYIEQEQEEEAEEVPLPASEQERTIEELISIFKSGKLKQLENQEVVRLVTNGNVPLYALEKQLSDTTRAVAVRRLAIAKIAKADVLTSEKLPYQHYDFDRVLGACCENVIGYMPLPVGIAGPLIIDDKPFHIPMATTEGCLVASTMRGCKAINAGGGATTVLTQDGMTRGPCVSFTSLKRAGAAKIWIDSEEGQKTIKKAFNSTSRFARLQHITTALAGTLLFIRFRTTTGDAMGMNMISKGVEYSLKYLKEECGFEDMEVISLSGNYCTDKKPAAINWIEGRGKSVVAEATIPGDVVKKVLKSDVDALVELNVSKNLVGSAMAGSVGGFNAHAANIVTAIFLATGQDPAQNVESSNCITLMKNIDGNLQISVSMPCIEVGTIGGGTILDPQASMLELLGVKGPHPTNPGDNARQLARIVACGVLAAELSLCSALAAGHLVKSHMIHNRSKAPTPSVQSSVDLKRLSEGSKICIKS